jgi:Protein of unknown function (DUF551)
MKTPEEMAEEHANWRCPEQGPEYIVWCMCKDDFLTGYEAAKDQLADADKSDGYHTFNELYEHRTLLFLSALKAGAFKAQMVCEDHYPEWDVITCYTPNNYEQISYHVPIKYRDFYSHLDRCSKEQQENNFDGHDSKLVAQRIEKSLLQTNLPTPAKWISVKERLPNYNEEVLFYSIKYPKKCFVGYRAGKKEYDEPDELTDTEIFEYYNFWMPLPEPPKEEE